MLSRRMERLASEPASRASEAARLANEIARIAKEVTMGAKDMFFDDGDKNGESKGNEYKR